MKFKRLADQAKRIVDQRGGTEALKRDAEEVKGIARGKGSLSEKARAAAQAIKEPGAGSTDRAEPDVVDQQGPAVAAAKNEAQDRGERPS